MTAASTAPYSLNTSLRFLLLPLPGADGGNSIHFLRRGTVSAKASLSKDMFGPDVTLFDIDAGTRHGCGSTLGEHALMAKQRKHGNGSNSRLVACLAFPRAHARLR